MEKKSGRPKARPPAKYEFRIKRAYDAPSRSDGLRFLVDRLWPRGIRKEALSFSGWLREAAPSASLRKWFGHEAARWPEFQKHYRAELEKKPEAWNPLLEAIQKRNVTLLFGARDVEMNNAAVLKEFLKEKQINNQ